MNLNPLTNATPPLPADLPPPKAIPPPAGSPPPALPSPGTGPPPDAMPPAESPPNATPLAEPTPEPDAATPWFGRVPGWWASSGRLATLTRSELAAALVLAAHSNADYSARPGVARIAAAAGLSRRSAVRALRGLERAGLIEAESRGGGRATTTVYRLRPTPKPCQSPVTVSTPKPCQSSDTVFTPKPCQSYDTVFTAKRCHSATETVSKRDRNHAKALSPQQNRTEYRTEQQQRSIKRPAPSAARPAAAAGSGIESQCKGEEPPDAASAAFPVRKALTAAGIGEPARGRLAQAWSGLPNAAERIAAVAQTLRGRGKGTGAIVRELEALAEAERACTAADAAASAAAAEQAARRTADDAAARRAEATERAADAAVVAAIDDAQLQELLGEILAGAPWLRRTIGPDPRRSRILRPLLAAAARAVGGDRRAQHADSTGKPPSREAACSRGRAPCSRGRSPCSPGTPRADPPAAETAPPKPLRRTGPPPPRPPVDHLAHPQARRNGGCPPRAAATG